MTINYFHVCGENIKCKCGWTGCECKTKYAAKKISDKHTEIYRVCPKCNEVVLTGTQTTT